jgi:nucleotide-binding universal stress UspA family protein
MKLMVAYDGSEMAQRALTVAQKRAKALQAELHIFTSGNGNLENTKNTRLKLGLKDVEMLCQACNIDCRIEMTAGTASAGEEIIKYAGQNLIDEIVIGLRKRSQLGKMLFGSTSRQVILEAPCPVLTVK